MWWGEVQSHATWRHGCIRRKLISSHSCPCWKQHGMDTWVGTGTELHVSIPLSLWEEDSVAIEMWLVVLKCLRWECTWKVVVKKTLKILTIINIIRFWNDKTLLNLKFCVGLHRPTWILIECERQCVAWLTAQELEIPVTHEVQYEVTSQLHRHLYCTDHS